MSEKSIFENQDKEVPYKEQIQEINDAIKQGNFSSAEFRLAYQISLGLSEDETSYPDKINDKVKEFAEKLRTMNESGLPLTTITGVLKETENKESAVDVYYELVDSLGISDREKEVLYSILKNKRSGLLIVSDPKTLKDFAKIKISEFPKDNYPAYQIAEDLTAVLSVFKGGAKIEISFME